jgi:hypothetical protein
MKDESKFLKLVLVGVLGAAAMMGCSDDNAPAPESENAVDTVAPEDSTSTTVKASTTTVEETTTTTTVAQTTTTVKSNKPNSTTTRPPATPAPTLAPTPTAPPETTPTTLPPVNVSYFWSSGTGCGGLGSLILDVDVTGATSAGTISVSVNGSRVSSYGGPTTFGVGDTSMIMFDQWPILSDGTYPVTITASSETQGPTTRSTSVTYNCLP